MHGRLEIDPLFGLGVVFNIIINDLDERMECTLRQANTRLGGSADLLGGSGLCRGICRG